VSSAPPKNWREIRSADGELLYLDRLCGRFWIRFELGEWWAYYDAEARGFGFGVDIGKCPSMSQALHLCREHMIETGMDFFVPT
jgi:hypothetical protein